MISAKVRTFVAISATPIRFTDNLPNFEGRVHLFYVDFEDSDENDIGFISLLV